MSSRSGPEETLTLPTEQQADAPVAAMDAKLMVATGSGAVQQLKDLVKKHEQDSKMMVVVMAKQQAAASAEKAQQGNMDPHLLALASSGSYEKLKSLLFMEDSQVFSLLIQQPYDNTAEESQACAVGVEEVAAEGDSEASADGVEGSLPMRQASGDIVEANELIQEGIPITAEAHTASVCASSFLNPEEGQACANDTDGSLHMRRACDDIEANELILEGVTAQGDTALHVVAACVQGDNFLESARIIYWKAKHLLFVQNNNGDTPLHCASRAGKSNMVKCLIQLALGEGGEGRMKELLRKENKHKETALHEAIRVGNMSIVDLLMVNDSELATFPEDGGASPMYLAIMLNQWLLQDTLYRKSHGKLSFSGPNGQNALHAAVARGHGVTKLLEWNKAHLCPQNKDLTTQRDGNGSTPLHFAAARTRTKKPSSICRLVLEANPDALYQPDHAGFFPIHVAASVGASWNVDMFVKRYPGSAGLRDAKGRTFVHVAVEKRKRSVISSACRNLSLSWIMNMVDNDGNTALHLAVKAGILRMFCPLLGNPQVNLNLPNNNGKTPFDIAEYNFPEHALMYNQNSEAHILRTLRFSGAVKGVHRRDHLVEDNRTLRVKHDESKLKMEVLKDSTGTLCIGSVLIATVTFGATFAVPGGYIADDHSNGGSPVLAQRYAFDAFIASNTLAFIFSAMATISLMYSGSPLVNPRGRRMHLTAAVYLLSISITSLVAAFALGAYVVLAPVSHKTAVATCALSSLVLLYEIVEFIWRHLLLLPALRTRKGLIWTAVVYASCGFIGNMLSAYWPLIIIFGWAAHANPAPTLQAAPAQAPAPLA